MGLSAPRHPNKKVIATLIYEPILYMDVYAKRNGAKSEKATKASITIAVCARNAPDDYAEGRLR